MPMHYRPHRKTLLDRAGSLVHTTFSLSVLRPARKPAQRRTSAA
jgi:hypothetical protein